MEKKFIKKIFSTALALCMTAPVLAGCKNTGDSDSIPEGTEVVLKISPFNGGYGLGWLAALKEAYEAKNPGVYITYPSNVVDRSAQQQELTGGVYKHDLYFTGFSYYAILRSYKNNFLTLDDVYEKIGENVITPSVAEWMTYEDGHMYSLPWATALGGILYHEDYFNANNIEIPNTSNELVAVAQQINTIRGGKKTGYPFAYSYQDNYWEYLFNTWLAQYEGIQGYENYLNCMGTNGTQYDTSWVLYNGVLRTLEAYEPLLNDNNQYNLPNSKSDDFTTAQFRFLDKQSVMMVNGDWIIQEMQKGEFDIEQTKDVCVMKTPIISSIVEKMELWSENAGVGYTDLSQDKKDAYDAKLSAIVEAVDAGTYDASLCSESDYNRIKEARRVTPSLSNFHNAVVPASAKEAETAKDFLAFMYSPEGIALYAENVYGAGLPVQYTEAQIANLRNKSRFIDTMYDQLNSETYLAFNYGTALRNRAFTQNGLKILNGLTTEWYRFMLATPGSKEYKSAKTIYIEHTQYTVENWAQYTMNLN